MKWYRLYRESSDSDFIINDGVLNDYKGKGGKVVIPDGVEIIGWYAFNGCSGLTSVTIPNSVTSIRHNAFEECSGLTSVTIGNGVTSIEERAFKYCNGLTSVRIPDSVKNIDDYAFFGCENLKSLIIGNGVKRIGIEAFENCKKLKAIKFGENVEKIGWASFLNCTSLTSVTIPENVKTIGRAAFANCSNLTKVKILNPNIEIVDEAFDNCPLKIDPNDKILCKIFSFGIFGLEVTKYDSYWSNPEYVRFNGGKEFHIRDIAGMISHHTIRRPLNDDWSGKGDYSMLCKAEKANPELFRRTLTKLLSGKKIDSWWDDTKGKWETDEKTLRKKNKDREEWQRNADMMNGL